MKAWVRWRVSASERGLKEEVGERVKEGEIRGRKRGGWEGGRVRANRQDRLKTGDLTPHIQIPNPHIHTLTNRGMRKKLAYCPPNEICLPPFKAEP
jgi:hypothetical protein